MQTFDGIDVVEAGRRLGHDFYQWTRMPMPGDWPCTVQEGFNEAALRSVARHNADRFQRKWLQLRLGALHRGRAVADDVTVQLLRQLDVSHCPVTREVLTHGTLADTDWSVDRLNNDGAYVANNLAVMSVRANRAKGALSFEEVLALSKASVDVSCLRPRQWLRLAVLMMGPAFATRQHLAPILPLCAPLPFRSVRLAVQQIQRLFTLQAARPAGKNRLVRDFLPACPTPRSEHKLRQLADAVHEGLKRLGDADENWDVWLQPGVLDKLAEWRETLNQQGWATAAFVSGQLAGARRVSTTSLKTWHLPTRGYLPGQGLGMQR